MNEVDLTDPKYRYEERVERLINKGLTRKEAEEVVTTVIKTKEKE